MSEEIKNAEEINKDSEEIKDTEETKNPVKTKKVGKTKNAEKAKAPARKDPQIFNPSTSKMISVKTVVGKKLLSLRESGIAAVSSSEAMEFFIRSLAPDLSDSDIIEKFSELNPAQKYAVESMIPQKWVTLAPQPGKPPRKTSASKIYYEKRRPEILSMLPVGETLSSKDLKEIISSEWKKISLKDNRKDAEYIMYDNMAKIANQDYESRVDAYVKLMNGVQRPLSAKDIEKMENNPGDFIISEVTGRAIKNPEKFKRKQNVPKDIKKLVYEGEDED